MVPDSHCNRAQDIVTTFPGKAVWKTVWQFLKKLEVKLENDPQIPVLVSRETGQ
jgi:hypothetical protein